MIPRSALLAILCASYALADAPAKKTPADLLALENFKLTLPTGEPEKPTEIKQPALATFTDEKFFFLSKTGDAVVFRAPVEGVTTKGSNYPRSELREMIDAGRKNASWTTAEGRHRITIRQSITRLPERKPQVVSAQIHDDKSDLITIRLDKKKLFVDHGGTHGATLTDDYKLGDIFTVEIVAENGTIKTYYNGGKAPADIYEANAKGCYFKVGCYTQSNLARGDKEGAYGEVHVYDVKVEHTP